MRAQLLAPWKGTHSFILVRHAEAPWSPDEARALSPSGRAAAERLAEQLCTLEIDAIYSSPYRRAVETVEPLAKRLGVPIQEIADLRERTLGDFRCASFDEAVAATWNDSAFAHPRGESNREAQRRAVAVLDALVRSDRSRQAVVATHGNLLTLLLNAFDERVGLDFWRSLQFPDAVELRLHPSGESTWRYLRK